MRTNMSRTGIQSQRCWVGDDSSGPTGSPPSPGEKIGRSPSSLLIGNASKFRRCAAGRVVHGRPCSLRGHRRTAQRPHRRPGSAPPVRVTCDHSRQRHPVRGGAPVSAEYDLSGIIPSYVIL
jgi:hypothetical protein